MDGMKLFWGLLLTLLGVTVIGINIGLINSSIWINILSLWPVILVAFGLKLLITNERTLALSLLGLLVLTIAFAYFMYSGTGGFEMKRWNFMEMRLDDSEVVSEDLSDNYDLKTIKRANINLSTGATNVKISAVPGGSSENVLYRLKSEDMGRISVAKSTSGDEVTLDINESNVGLHFGRDMMVNREITLYLPTTLIMDLKLDCGASKMNFDFRQIQIESSTMNIGASSGDIYLGEKPVEQKHTLSAGASNLSFHVPEQVGVDLNVDGGLKNLSLDPKLKYLAQPTKVTITGTAGVSNIKFLSE